MPQFPSKCRMNWNLKQISASTCLLWSKLAGFGSQKFWFIKVWHLTVSVLIIVGLLSSVICVAISKVEWTRHAFALRGFEYMSYLLSIWVTVSQLVYFNIYSAIDIIDIYSNRNPKLQTLQNHLHNAASYLLFMVVFPLSMLVTILFWTFYYWKREEMYPTWLDDVFPPILNHMMHTFPPILTVIYMFTSNRCEPPKTKTLAGLLAIISIYSGCVLSIKMRDGKWVYIVIDSLTPFQIKCTFAFFFVGSISFLFLGYLINDKVREFRKKILES